MATATSHVKTVWNEVVDAYLNGRRLRPPPLDRWFDSYSGQADQGALPDPYVGSLDHPPQMVFLGLSPGRVVPRLQAKDGLFADEIREMGSHSAWAASMPYFRYPWLHEGRNTFHHRQLRFMRRWLDSPNLEPTAMLVMQLYPWHSGPLRNRFSVDAGIVRDFVWEPIAELGTKWVFAFGADWFEVLAEGLQLDVVDRLGKEGWDYGSDVESRSVLVLEAPTGAHVVVEKHQGGQGPPSERETRLLREVIAAN